MSSQLETIQKILIANASAEALAAQQKFIPGTAAQKIYGVRKPVLNALAVQGKEGGFDLVGELWQSGSQEEKILAGKLLGKIARKDPAKALQLVRQFSGTITDWAVCDTLGMQGVKPLVRSHQQEIFALARSLNTSANPWQRRLSLVLVEWYTRDKKLHADIDKLVKMLENDKEYYVRKAVVWIRKNLIKGK